MALAPTRPIRTAEPAPPLRAVLDLPLRTTGIATEASNRIAALNETVRATPKDGDWTTVYEIAIGIVEAVADHADARLAELQRSALEMEDPAEVRQRTVEGPRREADRVCTEVKGAIQRVERDWTERSKRQLDHVLEKCLESGGKSLQTTEEASGTGLKLRVDAAWWAQFLGYIGRCCDEWTRNVTTGLDQDAAAAVRAGTAGLLSTSAGKGVPEPELQPAPATEARVTEDPPEKEAEVPNRGAALLRYIRSNVMSVSMFGTMFAVVIGIVFQFTGDHDGQPSARPISTIYVRGGLLMLVLPIVTFLGLRAGTKQRETSRAKAVEQHRQAVQTYLKTVLDKVLERHRKALERWIHARTESWTAQVETFRQDVLTPVLAEGSTAAAAAVKDLKLQQAKLMEEQNALKTFRNQVGQNLLFDLRKRHRELREGTAE